MQLTLAQGSDPNSAAKQFLSQQGIQAGQPTTETINGSQAVSSTIPLLKPPGFGWFYPDRADFIAVVGNWRSTALLKTFAAALKKIDGLPVETLSVMGNGFLVPQVRLSDHAPFWDAGFPALLLTDTAFMRNPNYHTAFDTIETLDFEFMAKVCRGIVNGVAGL